MLSVPEEDLFERQFQRDSALQMRGNVVSMDVQ